MRRNKKQSKELSITDRMELQLHEQFSINCNSGMSSIVSLLVGMFAAFGAWAYVLIYLDLSGSVMTCRSSSVFSPAQFILSTDGLLIVMAIVFYLCMKQGFTHRKEQFLIHAIRCKHYGDSYLDGENNKVYPKDFHPFGKKWHNVVVGLYNNFLRVLLAVSLLVVLFHVVIALKIDDIVRVKVFNEIEFMGWSKCIFVYSPEILFLLCFFLLIFSFNSFFKEYHIKENNYLFCTPKEKYHANCNNK